MNASSDAQPDQRGRPGTGWGYCRAVNGTGIILHTGLGRAPFSRGLVEELGAAIEGYTVLEVDRATGDRGLRERSVVELLKAMSGAEAGLIVNNNAAAVLLAVTVMAAGGSVVVSRGELVEIGGGFRMPNVVACAGARLCEAGTTNRTALEDYEAAVTGDTRLFMRVHASNFRLVGDQSRPARVELVALGRRLGVPVAEDLGSGLFDRCGLDCLKDEPTVPEAVAAGVDIVTFSGDKLVGGPQSGIILGREALVAAMRAHPLFRAVRPDKMALVVLERVLQRIRSAAGAAPDLPFFGAVARTSGELRRQADALAGRLRERLDGRVKGLRIRVVASQAFAGSGSVPARPLPSWAVAIETPGLSGPELAGRLRCGGHPVFAAVRGGEVRVDVMTLMPGDDHVLASALANALGSGVS